jgi:hypothetical protein
MDKVSIVGSAGMIGAGIARTFNKVFLGKSSDLSIINDMRFGISNPKYDVAKFENSFLIISCGPRDEDIENIDKSYLDNVKYFFKSLPKSCKVGYISSARVFEGCDSILIDENTKMSSKSSYSNFHIEIEGLLRGSLRPHIILRPQAVYNYNGCKSNRDFLITNSFPQNLLSGNEISLKTDGSQIRNFISADDIGRAMLAHMIRGTVGAVNILGIRSLSIKNYKFMLESLYKLISNQVTNDADLYKLNKISDVNSYSSMHKSISSGDILLDSLYFLRKNYV